MRFRVAAGGLVALSLPFAACSARPPTAAIAAKPALQAPPVPIAWRIVRYPKAPSQADVVEVTADGTQRLLVGGMRAEQRGKTVVLAEQASLRAKSRLLTACTALPWTTAVAIGSRKMAARRSCA